MEQRQAGRAAENGRDLAPVLQPRLQHFYLFLLCGQRDPVNNTLLGHRMLLNKEATEQVEIVIPR